MTPRFWLLQVVGWSCFLLLAYVARPSETGVPEWLQFAAVAVVGAGGLLASLGLRWLYRRVQADGYGELRWLGILLVASLVAAVVVDVVFYLSLALLAPLSADVAALHAAQPAVSRAAMLAPAFIAWSLLYLAISRQTRLAEAARHQHALRAALQDAQLQRLLGHLAPHFMFNTINNIRALILRDPEAAREQLARFASTLRYQFAVGDDALVTVDDEMAVVRDYLGLVGLQLGARLRYVEHVDPQALHRRVPRFCVQLLVENAIKHGLGPSRTGGDLAVDVTAPDDALRIEVRNTGQLVTPDGSGTGLANLRQRLHLSFGDRASLSLDAHDGRVVARVQIGSGT